MAENNGKKTTSFKRKGFNDKSTSSSSSKKFKVDGSSKQSSTSQKRALKHERQSHRKHADAVTTSKEIWNKLRLKTNSPDDIRTLMNELMGLIKGKTNEIALQHDASRVVQAAIQFGTPEQRKEVVKELCATGNLAELSKVQYAHFVVLKMIKYCYRDEECVRLIVKSLKGSIPKLAVHAVGARVVELLFSTFPQKSTAMLKQELYGPHFALFASGDLETTNPTLASNLEKLPDKKDVTLEYVSSTLNKGIDKKLFGFVYFQQLFAEYVATAPANDIRSIAPSVVDHSIHLLSTRAGTRVVVACASYGTAKDRKRIMKSLKGYTRSSLLHRDAYLAILRLVQVTDDTVSVNKSVLGELLTTPENKDKKSPLLELATNDSASKLFLMLLVAKEEARQKYLDPYERELLEQDPCVMENGKDVPTSKKNPETRRKELLQNLQKALIDMCTRHTDELIRSIEGSRVIREVYAAFHPKELVVALLDACDPAEPESGVEGDVEKVLSVFEDPIGHRTIKSIFVCDAEFEKDTESSKDVGLFAHEFVTKFGSKLGEIGKSSRGAFVLTALLKVASTRDQVAKKLSEHKAEFSKLANGKKPTAGFEALLHEMGDGSTKKLTKH